MIWNDEQGYHFVVGGVHWIAQYRIERPDWTPEQERAAAGYIFIGILSVTILLLLETLFIVSMLA